MKQSAYTEELTPSGLHWLCDYHMNLAPDTTLVRNPQRTHALARLRAHEQTVTDLEQQIGQHHTTTPTPTDTNPAEALCMLQADLYAARADTLAARKALKPIPAKLPANTIDPNATRATPRITGVTVSRHRALLTTPSVRPDPLPMGEQAGLSFE
jgi:hypothetical protein